MERIVYLQICYGKNFLESRALFDVLNNQTQMEQKAAADPMLMRLWGLDFNKQN